MKGVDTIARVRREHFVRGKTIKQIVRDLHVSRNTVRKILRSVATAFEYERTVQPQPRLGPWRAELERLLVANAARSSRERLTLMRIFEALRGLGYTGGYDAVRRWARRVARGPHQPPQRLSRPALGDPCRHGRALDPQAQEGQLPASTFTGRRPIPALV